jgi:hypothetical protein
MPATAVETIRQEAVVKTLRSAEDVISLPWADGLPNLELFITNANPAAKPRLEKDLIEAIAGGSGFMIALVFDKTHNFVVALPLPEVFDGSARTELGLDRINMPVDLADIHKAVHRTLLAQRKSPVPWIQPGVVLIEQNLGRNRRESRITVASLNTKTPYIERGQYEDWIKRTQDELNSVSSSGK